MDMQMDMNIIQAIDVVVQTIKTNPMNLIRSVTQDLNTNKINTTPKKALTRALF